jgi:hypothetical protein
MATTIDPSSIKLSLKEVFTKITIDDFRDLKENPFDFSAVFSPTKDIRFSGQVRFALQPLDDLVDWQVGFVQIVIDRGCQIRYAGRTPNEGSIVCTVRPFRPLLDCRENQKIGIFIKIPWYENSPSALFIGSPGSQNLVDISMADFPSYGMPGPMQNKVTNVFNFLSDFTAESDFWTILTAISPTNVRQYLGYCRWRIRYKASFVWRSGELVVSDDFSRFIRLEQDKGDFTPGPPVEAELQTILANPTRPIANDETFKQYVFAVKGGGDFFNHVESDRPLSPVSPFFWG